ncbi:5-methylcytosine-specific restriction endonuclease McrBC, GTP-binding regulatory subunit McrB [Algoriphagus ornithinivorans]|uniref:5-methylcytosine-specific restriction endonuclease McrBC, GTP-binding regulatory subunit McrB n=1 Tax=Algoriphagus ornithinivorans TaxID=226506 RepID=A0A1I5GTL3_9BACT|nr:DUF3578 domain-containing protein [Algoriphagus ornithinivorans]SFO39176.1 5-methylcytosine-specific restriction endonuclease McrBC, GTP-binding regulatory subunit McrB [Algoriphagus ornithinivorans]
MELFFSRDELVEAIKKIDEDPSQKKGRQSSTYDLIYEGKNYPPILVLSVANQLKGGKDLTLEDFGNNVSIPFKILRENDFEIIPKKSNQDLENHMSYYDELIKFLDQAKTTDLKTKGYLKSYANLKVKVSFGQGYPANIPWISFLADPYTTADGIYPVYLYYKDEDLLILAHGISETTPPKKDWNLEDAKRISKFFEEESLNPPYRYGDSFVFRVYDTTNLPSREAIDSDLNQIIERYLELTSKIQPFSNDKFEIENFIENSGEVNLIFNPLLIKRFATSLISKQFLILTGLSGSGKTKLAQSFVKWISSDSNQYRIIPVGADWTNREPLLGYPNALNPKEYVKPENGALDLLIEANENPYLPFFLILDEMNLSHVERYFADFLSAMESGEEIFLHSGTESISGIPSKIKIPKNLFIIGTVNIDETTHMFSPKVLDRANTVEFRITPDEMSSFLNQIREINMENLESKGAGMAKSFLEMALDKSIPNEEMEEVKAELGKFFAELKKVGAEFGYRSATEILKLIDRLGKIDSGLSQEEKLDITIIQKLLPKLHGSRRKLVPVLTSLANLCLKDSFKPENENASVENKVFEAQLDQIKYPISYEKLSRMHKAAIENGFASFAEA